MVGYRYYNPEWGRWIQPDDIEYLDPTNINGLNLYAYCFNNDPINKYDPTGYFAISTFLIGLVIGVAVGAGLGAWTGAGSQNTKSMIDDIMLGKLWGSKAFLNAANSLTKQPGNRTMTMIIYNNMAKAITKYQIQAIAKVGIGIGASTIGGSLLGGLFL